MMFRLFLICATLLTVLLIIGRMIRLFNKDSIVAKTWFSAVLGGVYKYKDVPNLLNLREEVGKLLVAMGYDIENEDS